VFFKLLFEGKVPEDLIESGIDDHTLDQQF